MYELIRGKSNFDFVVFCEEGKEDQEKRKGRSDDFSHRIYIKWDVKK